MLLFADQTRMTKKRFNVFPIVLHFCVEGDLFEIDLNM